MISAPCDSDCRWTGIGPQITLLETPTDASACKRKKCMYVYYKSSLTPVLPVCVWPARGLSLSSYSHAIAFWFRSTFLVLVLLTKYY
jgi:hypothetical protein